MVLAGNPIRGVAVWYIALLCLCFGISSIAFDWRRAIQTNQLHGIDRAGYLNSPVNRTLLYVCATGAIGLLMVDLYVQGLSAQRFLIEFFVAANEYMRLRYDQEVVSNLYSKWGLVFAFLCPILGGLQYVGEKSSSGRLKIVLLSFLPPLSIMLLQAAKGIFVLSIVNFIGSIVAARIVSGVLPYLDLRSVVPLIVRVMVAAPFLLIAFMSRGFYQSDDMEYVTLTIGRYLLSYAFSQLYAFSDWFSSYLGLSSLNVYDPNDLTYGFYTFISLFKMFGSDREVALGTYDEYLQLGEMPAGNVYTIFRGAVMDFGVFGGAVFFLVLGVIFNTAYYSVLTCRRPIASLALIVLFVQFIYMSYLISPFIYNITFLVFVLLCGIFLANKFVFSRRVEQFGAPL